VVASPYRSYADQQVSYARLTSIYGMEAGEMSAYPGHSQHQLGTAVDFTNAAAGYEIWQYVGNTSASWWLREHAPEYGFVLAYPPRQRDRDRLLVGALALPLRGQEERQTSRRERYELARVPDARGVLPRC
jgi:zinc D-Ala-D-Ala carboxypeptidase